MSDDPLIATASDEELLVRVASGDATAFAALFRRRRTAVYRFALHMTGAPAAAEDVTQDVFLAVMHDAPRYEPARATVTAWLCGIARNHARRRLQRDRLVLPFVEDEVEDSIGIPAAHADPLDDLTRAERLEALRKAVLSLPLKYREAVVLCDLQEVSYADAAAAIGCALGTVRSRLHRGRSLLAAKLGVSHDLSPVR
jgi:RNA polymerase sigma-70 factor (ECF subfamily)